MSTPGRYKPSYFYQMDDEVLKQVQSTPYLSIELSEDTIGRGVVGDGTLSPKYDGTSQKQ